MPPAICVENLGKRYRVNHAAPRDKYRTLRESLADAATAPLRRLRNGGTKGTTEDFWALKDVNFEVQPGEVVGFIGRNGAGKSTLLKVLSRITQPTTGEVRLRGRIASLLEVGTGFHPELTGRENIYLNGSILGMSHREIASCFDEIVAFAEVEQFLDTPVKRYSSGMYVRLAFAVAAHLEPDVLIIDEVLAVGDAAFQKKCLIKMHDVACSGRTVLFVSHNVSAIQNICSRCVLLNNGRVSCEGRTSEVIKMYMDLIRSSLHSRADVQPPGCFQRHKDSDGTAAIRSVTLLSQVGEPTNRFRLGEPFTIRVEIDSHKIPSCSRVAVIFKDMHEHRLASFHNEMVLKASLADDARCVEFAFPGLPFVPGSYSLDVVIYNKSLGARVDAVEKALDIEVMESDVYGSGYTLSRNDGIVMLKAGCHVMP